MDPDANIEQQLELARVLANSPEIYTSDELALQAGALAELVIALNEWIDRGGYFPQSWVPKNVYVVLAGVDPMVFLHERSATEYAAATGNSDIRKAAVRTSDDTVELLSMYEEDES